MIKVKMNLDIIIVNWNAGLQLRECLDSILCSNLNGINISSVVVVDNASSDASADGLEDTGLPLIVIYNKENLGFGAACNQGAKNSVADYLLFLNPDTRLSEDSLNKSVFFMNKPENQDIGIVGIQLVNDDHVAQTCARFPQPGKFFSKMVGLDYLFPKLFPSYLMTEWDHNDSREVDHVIGAFFLVRRSLFELLHGFDERFFVYLEDLDFSLRAKQVGFQSFFLKDVEAYHKGGGTSQQIKATRLFYSLRSRILYSYKHFNWGIATCLLIGTILLEPISRVMLGIARRSVKEIFETFNGYTKLWFAVPTILKAALLGGNNEDTSPQ